MGIRDTKTIHHLKIDYLIQTYVEKNTLIKQVIEDSARWTVFLSFIIEQINHVAYKFLLYSNAKVVIGHGQ